MSRNSIVLFLLRASLALAFIYPAVSALHDPDSWIGFFPQFLRDLSFLSEQMLLRIWGVIEVVIGLWILSGQRIFIPSITAAILLAGIVWFNQAQFINLFRDASLALVALALAVHSFRR